MHRLIHFSASTLLLLLVAYSPAQAQPGPVQQTTASGDPAWQVEFHAGGLIGPSPTTGTPILQFPAGTPITMGSLAISRAVPSWFYGDGARLLNDVNTLFNVDARIEALDVTLQQAIAEREGGRSLGARISRDITPRYAVELSVEYSDTPLRLTPEAEQAVAAAKDSFVAAFQDLLATGYTFNRVVTSTAELEPGEGFQIATTGTLVVRLGDFERLHPYVTGGGGMLFNRGTAPSATLTGRYAFDFAGLFPHDETDTVTIRTVMKDRVAVAVLGAGLTYEVSSRHGVRIDVRLHLSENPANTVIDAHPSVAQLDPAFSIATGLSPAIQFSNNPATGRRSSLSGDAVSGLVTFDGSGVHRQVLLSVGYFVRF